MRAFPYRRVLVIGSPGSGKSTFSRGLRDHTDLPLVHLDLLYWRADKTTLTREGFCTVLEGELDKDAWIIDGNYSFTMERRLARADAVFFFDLPVEKCLDGIRKRRNQPRADMPWIETQEDAEFTAFVREFPAARKPQILQLLAKYPSVPVVTFHSHEEADEYLKNYAD